MHQGKVVDNMRVLAFKSMFFLLLITFSVVMYLESKAILDMAYAFVVLVLFIEFLNVKLYQ